MELGFEGIGGGGRGQGHQDQGHQGQGHQGWGQHGAFNETFDSGGDPPSATTEFGHQRVGFEAYNGAGPQQQQQQQYQGLGVPDPAAYHRNSHSNTDNLLDATSAGPSLYDALSTTRTTSVGDHDGEDEGDGEGLGDVGGDVKRAGSEADTASVTIASPASATMLGERTGRKRLGN